MTEVRMIDALNAYRHDPDSASRAEAVAKSPHARKQLAMAAKFLWRFFDGKTGRDGRIVRKKAVLTRDNMSTVLNTAISPGIDLFYAILEARQDHRCTGPDGPGCTCGRDIRYLVSVLHDCRRLKIPQNIILGIACAHARLVGTWEPPALTVFSVETTPPESEDEDGEDFESSDELEEVQA